MLLAVYRGKMSEGISFNDGYARGVLCVGIPFPSFYDAQARFKGRSYLLSSSPARAAEDDEVARR